MDDLSFYVPNVHFEQIPIKNLVSNQDYQRNLSQVHTAVTSGRWCGGERPECGHGGRPVKII